MKDFLKHREEFTKAGAGKKDFANALEDVENYIRNPNVKYLDNLMYIRFILIHIL